MNQGGGVAAPVAGQILGEVLPYMEIAKQEEIKENIKMPNVTGLTFEEAKKTLKDVGIETNSQLDAETVIKDQLPKAGIQITN